MLNIHTVCEQMRLPAAAAVQWVSARLKHVRQINFLCILLFSPAHIQNCAGTGFL